METGRCYRCVFADLSKARLMQSFSTGVGARYTCVNNLGIFPTELEAALARDTKARQLEGQYAYINVPDAAQPDDGGPKTEDSDQASNPKHAIRNPKHSANPRSQ